MKRHRCQARARPPSPSPRGTRDANHKTTNCTKHPTAPSSVNGPPSSLFGRQSSVVCRPSSVVGRLPPSSVIGQPSSLFGRRWSVVGGQSSVVSNNKGLSSMVQVAAGRRHWHASQHEGKDKLHQKHPRTKCVTQQLKKRNSTLLIIMQLC
jgi:hypothetical protein